MKLLTRDEAKAICLGAGLDLFSPHVAHFGGSPKPRLVLRVPDYYKRVVYFAEVLLSLLSTDGDRAVLLWKIDDIVSDETTTNTLFDQVMTSAVGYRPDPVALTAQLLDGKERDLTFSLFLLYLLGEWDALLLPQAGRFFLSLSHHRVVDVHCKDDSEAVRIAAHLKEAGIEVQNKGDAT